MPETSFLAMAPNQQEYLKTCFSRRSLKGIKAVHIFKYLAKLGPKYVSDIQTVLSMHIF